jgi:hypothetical protein
MDMFMSDGGLEISRTTSRHVVIEVALANLIFPWSQTGSGPLQLSLI